MPESTAPPRLRIPGAPLTFEPHAFRRPRPNGHKRPPSGQRFHLWVSGCQMNESDADYLSQGLTAAGFSAVADLDQADLAILVTCSVRQNAEQKAYGRFRELKAWKRARPGRAIAMTGCMANKEKDRLYERLPDLDYRFDMRQYEAFIEDLQGEYETDPAQTGGVILQHGLTAYVPVIFGCNEVCSFCIVPFVRGTERSRPLPDVVDDVRRFANQGVREVTLLGQTVNSYRDPDTKAGLTTLSSSRCAAAIRSTSTVPSSPTPATSSPISPSRPMSSLAIRVRRRSNSSERWPCSRRSSSTWSTSRASRHDRAPRRPGRRMMWRRPRRNAGSMCCSRPSGGSPKMRTGAGWAGRSRC